MEQLRISRKKRKTSGLNMMTMNEVCEGIHRLSHEEGRCLAEKEEAWVMGDLGVR